MADEPNPSQLEDTTKETKMTQKGSEQKLAALSTEDNATDDVGLYRADSACTIISCQRDDEVTEEDVKEDVAPVSSEFQELTLENFEKIQRQKKRAAHKQKSQDRQMLMKNLQNAMEADETKRNTKISIMSEAYDETLMREELSSEDADSDDIYTRQSDRCTVSFKDDFIRNFDDLPNISDISSEEELPRLTNYSAKSIAEIDPTLDFGRFVDPLTGEPIRSTSSTSTVEVSIKEEKEEEQDSSELDLMLPVMDYSQTENEKDTELDQFLQIYAKESTVVQIELPPKELEEAEVKKIIADLIHDYVNEIVQRCEYIDPDTVLRKQLNKKKLILALQQLVSQYTMIKYINKFVNQKATEYCKRMKAFRLISPLSSELQEISRPRYYSALLQLDHIRNLDRTAKRVHNRLMASVAMDLKYVQNISMYTEQALEATFQRYLVRRDSEYLQHVVKRLIANMARMRNEISDTRLRIITIKNTDAQLNDRIEKHEHIDADRTMSQFIAIQNDIGTMDKKLEERNGEMARSLRLHNKDLAYISHMRDKCLMVENALRAAKMDLQLKYRTEAKLREKIYKLKLKHMDLLKQHKLLSARGGLLNHPRLMKDFDLEHEKVIKKRAVVAKLKADIRFIKQQLKLAKGSKASRKSSMDSSFEFNI